MKLRDILEECAGVTAELASSPMLQEALGTKPISELSKMSADELDEYHMNIGRQIMAIAMARRGNV